MPDRASAEANLARYDRSEVAAHYASLAYLTLCERLLFEGFIKPGSAVLDLGVGGGRTTWLLASMAARYIGVDYAPAMVKICRERFPGLEFVVADAAGLDQMEDGSFQAVVFAFNGIDYVLPDASRMKFLEHIRRILKPEGVLIFSSHNPRAILVPVRWNQERLRTIASRWSGGWKPLRWMVEAVLTGARFALALVQSCIGSLVRLRRLWSSAFWQGQGTFVDSAHGGLLTHCWTPDQVIDELNRHGFRVERVLGDDYPAASRLLCTDWYYYVFARR